MKPITKRLKNGNFTKSVYIIDDILILKDFIVKGMSLTDISKIAKCSKATVKRRLESFGLQTQKLLKIKRGKEHHNFNGNRICNCGSSKSSISKNCRKCRNIKLKNPANNSNYKGILNINVIVRSRVMPDWRKKVFLKDNFTCKVCGDNRGGNLEAHHIKKTMENKMYTYKAKYITNYDGDTITVDIFLGFGIILKEQKLRLYGINAPELKGKDKEKGKASKDYLSSILTENLIIKTYKDKKEKYGRWLADVYNDKGDYINGYMVKYGYADVNFYGDELKD